VNKRGLLLVLSLLVGLLSFGPVSGQENLYRVAVLPFDDGSIDERWWGDYDVGSGVADVLVTSMLNLEPKRFRLIERDQINRVLAEQDFGTSGRVDAKSAAAIGKILGVQFLVIGKVTEFTNKTTGGSLSLGGKGLGLKTTTSRVALDARLVDTNTAEIVAAVTGNGEKKQSNVSIDYNWHHLDLNSEEFRATNLGIALREATDKVAKQLGEKVVAFTPAGPSKLTGYVAYASDSRVILNIGSKDGVKVGMVFDVLHIIEEVRDPETGEVIDEISEVVAEIKVTEVKDKSATCSVQKKLSREFPIAVKDKVVSK
jgi:curli biogenesis system outer membrane secretion channel CsgG